MIKYGLISETDARCLEKTIDLVCGTFNGLEAINFCEIGVYGGDTGVGVMQYLNIHHQRRIFSIGIDNNKDGELIRGYYDRLIIGNSNEVYNQIEDNSQHLIFVDGCHCFSHVVSDFFCYAPKVKVGGYLAFHDTNPYINAYKDFQHGDKEDMDAYISVRRALKAIGLLILDSNEQWFGEWGQHFRYATGNKNECWELVYDEYDKNDEAGGICVFKKLY